MNIRRFLKILKEMSLIYDIKIYLIGGYIRDKLLNKKNKDLDIVVEHEFNRLIILFEKYFNIKPKKYSQFNTALFDFEKFSCDIVMARKEYYELPGKLPIVEPGTIEDDIKRRDFTINSIAYDIAIKKYIDPLNGIGDLNKKIIRQNRKNLFIEDPTRIFRVLKYKNRLDFNIEKYTEEELIKTLNKTNLFDNVSKARISQEWKLILKEKSIDSIIIDLKKYNVLNNIFKNDIKIKESCKQLNDIEFTIYLFLDNQIEIILHICDVLLNGVKKSVIKDITGIKQIYDNKKIKNKKLIKKYPQLIKKILQ